MTTGPRLGWRTAPGPGLRWQGKGALLVGIAIAVLVGVVSATGFLVWHHPATTTSELTPAERSTSLASAMRKATGGLDTSTGRARIGQTVLTLPGEPYELYPDPVHIDGVAEVIFLANADVHADYDGRHDWQATVALAEISPELVGGLDLEHAGTRVLEELGERFFGGHRTQIKGIRSADRALDGHPGMEFRADVHYSTKGLPSSYDRAVVWLVRCEDGSVIAAISSVPNDATRQVRMLAAAALNTLAVV